MRKRKDHPAIAEAESSEGPSIAEAESSEGPSSQNQRLEQERSEWKRERDQVMRDILAQRILDVAQRAGCCSNEVVEFVNAVKDLNILFQLDQEVSQAPLESVADLLLPGEPAAEAEGNRLDPEVQLAMLGSAFTAEFKDPSDHLGDLLRALDTRREEATRDPLVVICGTSLIQSSGVGKTRSLVELSSKDVYICYCCFQRKAGFPLETPVMAKTLLRNSRDKEAHCRSYFWAWLDCLQKYLTGKLKLPAPVVVAQGGASSSSSSLSSKCRNWISEQVITNDHPKSHIIEAVTERWCNQGECTTMQLRHALNNVQPHLPRKKGVGILFVFDEASILFSGKECNNAGINIRRALSDFEASAFGVFVDTSSHISVLAPPQEEDPSLRVQIGKMQVVDPVWEIVNVNVFAEDLGNFPTLSSLTPDRIYNFGRPLWGSWMNSAREKGIQSVSKEVEHLALLKLCGGVQEEDITQIKQGQGLKEAVAMAVLGARLVVDVHPLCQLAVKLVANHLSFVLNISGDRRSVLTCEAWDPVVTEAACTLFQQERFRHAALLCLESSLEKSTVDEGKNGELLARYILIRAMDESRGTEPSVALPMFLRTLLGEDLCDGKEVISYEAWMSSPLAEGRVNVRGFHPAIGYTPNLRKLLEFFVLGKAVICKAGQPRFDFLIPVLLPSSDGEYNLTTDCMSFLGVQVKSLLGHPNLNFTASTWMNAVRAGIFDKNSVKPYVTLLMQLGAVGKHERKAAVVRKSGVSKRTGAGPNYMQKPLIVHGLSTNVYPSLSTIEAGSLSRLIHCRRHRLQVLEDKSFPKSVMPAAFQ